MIFQLNFVKRHSFLRLGELYHDLVLVSFGAR
jgi:hypothetical protein